MEDRKKLEIMRALHHELAKHFNGESKIESEWSAGNISVNNRSYTEDEFSELLEVLSRYAKLEASRLARLRDAAQELLE